MLLEIRTALLCWLITSLIVAAAGELRIQLRRRRARVRRQVRPPGKPQRRLSGRLLLRPPA